jgi:hypothetical protein
MAAQISGPSQTRQLKKSKLGESLGNVSLLRYDEHARGCTQDDTFSRNWSCKNASRERNCGNSIFRLETLCFTLFTITMN